MKGNCIKLSDFARDCGVTDRAVQKHLKKLETELEGHFERRGPQGGTWLDELAQEKIRMRGDGLCDRCKCLCEADFKTLLFEIFN